MVISNTTDATNTANSLLGQASTTSNSSSSATSTNPSDDLASEQTFLKLFVAQLQNQDPLDPNQQDPTQMVSELAQFSELEQLVNIGSQVGSIDTYLTSQNSTNSANTQAPQTTGQTVATQGS